MAACACDALAVPELRIADLLANPLADPEAHLDRERVRHYVEHPDHPPVIAFETPEGLLLADGHHRVAAARARGQATASAELRVGTRQDAVRFAARVVAAQRGVSVAEALARITERGRRAQAASAAAAERAAGRGAGSANSGGATRR